MKDYKKRTINLKIIFTVLLICGLFGIMNPLLKSGGEAVVAYIIVPLIVMLIGYTGENVESLSRHNIYLKEQKRLNEIMESMKANKMHMESFELEEIIFRLNRDV